MAIELHHLNTHGMMESAGKVLDGVARLKQRIAELEEERRWRKCSEELPEEQEIVWVYNETHKETINAIHLGRGMFVYAKYHSLPCSASYWLPMSKPKRPEVK